MKYLSNAVCFVVLVASAALGQQWQPVPDVPFRQLVAARKTFSDAQQVFGWQHLCFTNATSIVTASIQGETVYFAAAKMAVYAYQHSGFCSKVFDIDAGSGSNFVFSSSDSSTLVVLTSQGAQKWSCTSKSSCQANGETNFVFGTINRAKIYNDQVHIASSTGAFVVDTNPQLVVRKLTAAPALSITRCPNGDVFVGNNATLTQYQSYVPIRWEWVTDLETQSGGVYDGPIRDLDCDSESNAFMATAVALNYRLNSGIAKRADFQDGMPLNDSTIVNIEPNTNAIWIGTPLGMMRWSRGADEDDWRYFHGPRFLPLSSNINTIVSGCENETIVVSDQGISHLSWEWYTLAQKAALFEKIALDRHNRHGMVDEAQLSSLGNLSGATTGPSDNNGLWTSLVVAAQAFAYQLEPRSDRAQQLQTFFDGMRLLVDVTGIRGLMARSCVAPGEYHTPDIHWHNSTNPAYKGWQFKCDASSDEVVGHLFAYPLMVEMLPTTMSATAKQLMEDITTYIVKNDFFLIDVTGNHTQWGVWNPAFINGDRDWSDERGLNAMQILSYLHAVKAWTNSSDTQAMMQRAIDELTNATNQYDVNMENLKILSPDDDNYSDDELTFLPYFSFGRALKKLNLVDSVIGRRFASSLERTWQAVRSLRSAPWNAIYISLGGASATQDDVDSILWNLRTWPLELIDWPVKNTIRRDIRINPEEARNNHGAGNDNLRVLPAYERVQLRWNGDPHDLDGGSGMTEGDPGAWLMPYWLARYFKIIV